MVISHARKTLLVGLATVLAATATAFGVTEAVNGSIATAATEGDMPYAVEDFNYPDAAKIEAETGAILKRGDGHLLMTSCDGTEDIMIKSRSGQKDFCFNVTAKPAYLTLEIPQAYGIWTSADPVKTTIKEDGGTTTVINAPANDFTGYGEAGQSGGKPTTLIELRVAS
ncbi:hypothetical protein ACFC0C_26640 [Streptomyces sp. NPDC056178]|uniref:hypothetical protein n=1 Tax=unclassified Streptomyces TaxID=2593676 RepID=UPI0035DB4054